MLVTYAGVGVNVAIRVGQDQQVNIHVVQKGSEGGVATVIRGDLSKDTRFYGKMIKKTNFYILCINI